MYLICDIQIQPSFSTSPWKWPFLYFTFGEEVVHRQKVLAYGSYEFLIDVGSSLGLWLGLSVFGITDLGVDLVLYVRKFYIDRFKKNARKILQ